MLKGSITSQLGLLWQYYEGSASPMNKIQRRSGKAISFHVLELCSKSASYNIYMAFLRVHTCVCYKNEWNATRNILDNLATQEFTETSAEDIK